MWPVTMKPAAEALGIPVGKLRRWVNEGRFDHIPGMEWRKNGFQDERTFTKEWVLAVAADRDLDADLSHVGGVAND
jgi:hypothetical protein